MAFSPRLVKEWYKDLSVAELEKMYKGLESQFRFESKEDQIKYILDNFLNASARTNIKSTRQGLEELLKEKTGKVYNIENKSYDITLEDLMNFISSNIKLTFNKTKLIDFFNKVKNFDEEEKFEFLLCLMLNEYNLMAFFLELESDEEADVIFEKYLKINKDFYSENVRIG